MLTLDSTMKIGSTRTGQFLFEVVPTTGSSDTIMLDPSEARLLLEFLKGLNCSGISVRVAAQDPVPATCLSGDTFHAGLPYSKILRDRYARSASAAVAAVAINPTEK